VERLVPESTAAEGFERLRTGFARAAAACPHDLDEAHFLFGGQPARMRIVGKEPARHVPRPFEHLRIGAAAGAAPRLDIALWDVRETGVVVMPGEPPMPVADGETHTEISDTGRFVRQWTTHGTTVLDRQSGQIVGAVAWSDDVDVYQRGKPLARLLAEWYADQGVGVMHAGLVARGPRGVILAGKEGAGKSTLALACARAGLDFLGEDYAALQFLGDGSVLGHSAYGSVFLTPTAASWFPELAPHLTESRSPHEPKSLLLLSDVWPERLRRSAPITALAICRVGEGTVFAVRTATRAEALRAVAPSSLLSIHGRRKDSLDRLARLVERVPCFWLDQGRDLASAGACLDALLDGVGSR
jgi:hypothetical protein